jgi:outer membrane protein TolC
MALDIVDAVARARQDWVRAVAAREAVAYAEQVSAAADASAELARRMQASGNFSRLQQAREQGFAADATAQLARARKAAMASREALVRTLGLDAERAARLALPDRLPELPPQPRGELVATREGLARRLDVRAARAGLEATAHALGLTRITGYVDGLHAGLARNSETGKPPQKGYTLEVPLPLFDFGDARRAEARATYMAAFHRVAAVSTDAASHLRESHAAYLTAYEVARHYRDEVVPLRKTIAEQTLLRYNGMLASVFELLADAREQAATVRLALDAQRDFWLADAALEATLSGRPLAVPISTSASRASSAAVASH